MPEPHGWSTVNLGIAVAKRHRLSRAERAASRARAEAVAAVWLGGSHRSLRLHDLSVADRTQTYRARAGGKSAILKLLPPDRAAASVEVHRLLVDRGVALPRVLWSDAAAGAIVYEDLGRRTLAVRPDRKELAMVMDYLARLHAAGRVDPTEAAVRLPALARCGWPTAAELAGRIVAAASPLAVGAPRLLDAAVVLAGWITEQPRVLVADTKREHFCIHDGRPMLTDLEFVSAWDVVPSNLASTLAFPGQFRPAIDRRLRAALLARYAEEHDRLEGTRTDVGELERAVGCAEQLIAWSLARASTLDPLVRTRHRIRTSGDRLMRDRGLSAASHGLLSIEHELGPRLFARMTRRLNGGRPLAVVDLGCGRARTADEIARRWPHHHVIAIDRDLSPSSEPRVCADAQALPLQDGSVDVVIAVQLLQYVPDKLRCLEEVYRVLAPGGLGVFAMTEHFGKASAFAPPLASLVRTWRPRSAVAALHERTLGSRRVLVFAIVKQRARLAGVQPFVAAEAHRAGRGSALPYLRSTYGSVEAGP